MKNDLRLSQRRILQQPLLLVSTPQSDKFTDCACPDRPYTVAFSEQGTDSMPHLQVSDAFVTALNENFHLVLSPFAPGGPTVINDVAWQRWHEFSTPRTLKDSFDKQLAGQRLIFPVDQPPIPTKQNADTFTVWMHITNACNLDCPYCYVRKSSQTLDIASGRAALDSVFSSALAGGFSRVKLKYAGGEATLHFRLIRDLHTHATNLAKTTSLELKEVILTNGTMLQPRDAAWCAAEDIKLMISLDGVGEVHDRLRPGRRGSSSFKQVEQTVDEILLPLNLRPDVTMTVTGANAQSAADVVKWAMLERHLPLSFNLYRANVMSVQHKELAWEEQTLIDGLLAAYLGDRDQYARGAISQWADRPRANPCTYKHLRRWPKLCCCYSHRSNRPVSNASRSIRGISADR